MTGGRERPSRSRARRRDPCGGRRPPERRRDDRVSRPHEAALGRAADRRIPERRLSRGPLRRIDRARRSAATGGHGAARRRFRPIRARSSTPSGAATRRLRTPADPTRTLAGRPRPQRPKGRAIIDRLGAVVEEAVVRRWEMRDGQRNEERRTKNEERNGERRTKNGNEERSRRGTQERRTRERRTATRGVDGPAASVDQPAGVRGGRLGFSHGMLGPAGSRVLSVAGQTATDASGTCRRRDVRGSVSVWRSSG